MDGEEASASAAQLTEGSWGPSPPPTWTCRLRMACAQVARWWEVRVLPGEAGLLARQPNTRLCEAKRITVVVGRSPGEGQIALGRCLSYVGGH